MPGPGVMQEEDKPSGPLASWKIMACYWGKRNRESEAFPARGSATAWLERGGCPPSLPVVEDGGPKGKYRYGVLKTDYLVYLVRLCCFCLSTTLSLCTCLCLNPCRPLSPPHAVPRGTTPPGGVEELELAEERGPGC